MLSVEGDWIAVDNGNLHSSRRTDAEVQEWMDDIVRAAGSPYWIALIDTERLIVLQYTKYGAVRPAGSLFIWVHKDLLDGSR